MTEWKEGDSATFSKTITDADVVLYAALIGDINPIHLDEEYAKQTRFGRRIAHGMLAAGLVSAVLGNKIPGHGAIYAGQTIRFLRPVYIGDTITVTATIISYDRDRGRMVIETICRNQTGEKVLSGEADVRYTPESAAKPQPTLSGHTFGNGKAG
jgi:3-hydroxybutyryl-CoA dehydratase